MEYHDYLDMMKEHYDYLLQLIENETIDTNLYQKLINYLKKLKILQDKEEMILFFRLLVKISNNHCRSPTILTNIKIIIENLSEYIVKTFKIPQIFNIFKSNKLIVLFLIDHKILPLNIDIVNKMIDRSKKTEPYYHYFFYPEIKEYLDNEEIEKIEDEFKKQQLIDIDFDAKRRIGKNHSYICELIQNDSIDEFVSHVNRLNMPVNSEILPSIFETNPFLIKNSPTLIEYASFYGSIQIFQYLKYNNAKLTSLLWIYSIHSNNEELIHILEENSIKPPNNTYNSCLDESIKCHHNNIANYIKDNYLFDDKPISRNAFKYYNYNQIPDELEDKSIFYYLCRYNYINLVKIYIGPKMKEIKKIILKRKFFS